MFSFLKYSLLTYVLRNQ
uniref:Uncharacterized protein n=1 Tax=Rhizophora mucronata TaxID=61149 RepID=A0A2P2QDV2_RHIMU